MSEDKDLVLIFSISGCKYAIGLKDLVEVKEGSELFSKDRPEGALGRIPFRGSSIPLMDVKKRLGLPRDETSGAGFIVVRLEETVFAFPVDTVEGVMAAHGNQIPFPAAMLEEKEVFPSIYLKEGRFVFSLNLAALYNKDFIASLNDQREEGE